MESFYVDAPHFDLTHTLECGQVFRWGRIGNNEFAGVIGRSLVKVSQHNRRISVKASNSSITPSFIKSYFDLTLDLPHIYNKIGKDKHIRAALKKFDGMRIIKQPLWECLASFIISTYNNIPRIKGIIDNISRCSGDPVVLEGVTSYTFPGAQVFADSSMDRLIRCGTGFRARYLKETAELFLKKKLTVEMLKKIPYAEAKKELMRFPGVGEKVADCVLLFSAGKIEAFPVDVWIKRIIQDLYFKGRVIAEKKIRAFASEYFGEYAGYAQQYLYHYARSGNW